MSCHNKLFASEYMPRVSITVLVLIVDKNVYSDAGKDSSNLKVTFPFKRGKVTERVAFSAL